MTEIVPFDYSGRQVRTVVIDGEPWFIAADVCTVLDIRNARDAVGGLDEDERGVATTDTPGGQQEVLTVNEAGLYSLIFRSRKATAKTFKRWVTHEVLPAIRKTGRYEASTAAVIPDMSTAEGQLAVLDMMRAQIEGRVAAEQRVAELEPAAESWETLANAQGDLSLRDAAQILSRDPDIEVGQNRLAKLLRQVGWIDKRTKRPYQAQIDAGRLSAIVSHWTDEDGEMHTKYLARVTAKGLEALRGHLNGSKPLPIRFPQDDVWGEAS